MRKIIVAVFCLAISIAIVVGINPLTVKGGQGKPKTSGVASDTGELPEYPACNGPKKRIALYRFNDGVNNQYSAQIRGGLMEALQNELQQTGCFVVLVTNEDMGDAAAEIAHGQSGMATGKYSPEAGKQLGAQMIVAGTLFEVAYTGGQGGGVRVPSSITGGYGGAIGAGKEDAKVVLMVKMFDPETRILVYSEKAEGKFSKRRLAVGADVQGVQGAAKINKETPVGDAAMRAIHMAVYIILRKMNEMPWQATVLKVEGRRILIRGGTDVGLKVGTTMDIFKAGEKIEDPDTGEMLQEPPTKMGQAKITQVLEKMSYCDIISGPAAVGMFVRMAQ